MAGLMTLDEVKCYKCGHTRSQHNYYQKDGTCTASTGDYGTCGCLKFLDPNLLWRNTTTPTSGGTMSRSLDTYKAAFARTQITAAQKRGRMSPWFTAGWTVGWVVAMALSMLAIWTPEHMQFALTGSVLFVAGGACGITRAVLYVMNKGAVIDSFDTT